MNTKLLFLAPLAALVCGAAPAAAQEDMDMAAMMAPAKQLEAYKPLLGTWRGKGAGKAETPDGLMEFEWTGESRYEMAYGGHFVLETTKIDVTTMGTILFKNFWGYDKENGYHASVGVSNMGIAAHSRVYWLGDDTILSAAHMLENGELAGERWTMKISEDELKLDGWKWTGAGEEIHHVWGKMTRADGVEPHASDASMALMPVAPQMEKLASVVGDYRIEGTVQMTPGMEMPIAASESATSSYGGAVLEMFVKGDETPQMPSYEGWGAYAWDSMRECYSVVWIDNFGGIMHGEARWHGDHLIGTSHGMKMGQPMVRRSIVELDEDGRFAEVTEHELLGTTDPFRAFHAVYKPAKKSD